MNECPEFLKHKINELFKIRDFDWIEKEELNDEFQDVSSPAIQNFIDKMKNIHAELLEYIKRQDNDDEKYFEKLKYFNQHELRLFLRSLSQIANDYQRNPHFFEKIEKILKLIKNEVTNNYSNTELINIFLDNKRIILFLINENIINVDYYFVHKLLLRNTSLLIIHNILHLKLNHL